MHKGLGPLVGKEEGSYDLAATWTRLTKMIDLIAARRARRTDTE